jgi:hypothetical protein
MQLTDTHQTKIYRGEGHQNSQVGQLIAEKVEFIDTAGNMYLNSPAAYILMRGNRLPRAETTAKLAFTPAGLQLVYSLLQNPNTLNAKYRELAEFAGISLGAVSIAIQISPRLGSICFSYIEVDPFLPLLVLLVVR